MSSSACRSRLTTCVGAGSDGQSERRRARAARPRRSTFACVPTAPEIEPTADPPRAPAPGARRRAASSAYQPAALKPNVIGSAWMPWLRPTIGVSRCWSARRRTTSISRASSSLDDAGRVAQDHRGGGVEDVRAGQAVVEPAALRPEALGDRAQEGDDVVLRLALDLARALRVDLADRAADPLASPPSGTTPGLGERLDGEELDLQPQLELAALPEDLAQLAAARSDRSRRPRVDPQLGHGRPARSRNARDSLGERVDRTRARIRAARCAGVLRAGAPDRDGRHRHAGRHLDDRVQRIGAAQSDPPSSGIPITGLAVSEASTPGRCAARPAAPMKSRTPVGLGLARRRRGAHRPGDGR